MIHIRMYRVLSQVCVEVSIASEQQGDPQPERRFTGLARDYYPADDLADAAGVGRALERTFRHIEGFAGESPEALV